MKIHFIGVGGIGISALAGYYLAKNWQVSGSDLEMSEITRDLKKQGAKIMPGHRALNLPEGVDRVIYSAAVPDDNPELVQARALGIPALSYAEELGELTKQYLTIAVSGAHGKSTTTAMLALMMIEGGLDPTVIIGTRLKEFNGSNFRLGKSRYLVIEADEWNRSFLHYHPTILVLTNIDKEHLDTYGDLEGVLQTFSRYFQNIAPGGVIIVNENDRPTARALRLKKQAAKIVFYGRGVWPLKIPGEYNQLNAEAAWQAAKFLGVPRETAKDALKNYKGSWRRLEPLVPRSPAKIWRQFVFFSDYGHHPTEIKVTLAGLKEKFPSRPLFLVFQPHQRERLTDLFADFSRSFREADGLVLLPVYQVAGREGGGGKTAADLYQAVKKPKAKFYLPNLKKSLNIIKNFRAAVVVLMGAGNIQREISQYFKSKLF